MQSLIERTIAITDLALELEPFEILADAKTHLANKPMTVGDEHAWELLEAAMQDIFEPVITCARCGKPESEHSFIGNHCPLSTNPRIGQRFTQFVQCEAGFGGQQCGNRAAHNSLNYCESCLKLAEEN